MAIVFKRKYMKKILYVKYRNILGCANEITFEYVEKGPTYLDLNLNQVQAISKK